MIFIFSFSNLDMPMFQIWQELAL